MSEPADLIRSYCRDGDQQAFRRFYQLHAAKLWKFLLARGCDTETAYDLVAEAFLRFIQTVCRDPRAPAALLYRIALNLRIDLHRRDKASATDSYGDLQDLGIPATPDPDDHGHVRVLIKTLPESEQNLLLLRYWIGLSHKEVAETTDLPEGTVRRQCAEALHKLRERWDPEEGKYAAK